MSNHFIHAETFDEVTEIVQAKFLIRPVLEIGTTGMIFGPSGVGKTFVTLDLALCVATGIPWAGMPCRAMPVVYVSAEGGRAFGRRMKAWFLRAVEHSGLEPEVILHRLRKHVLIVRKPVQIADFETRSELIAVVRSHFDANIPIGLVVIDTLARCAIALKENSAEDMTKFVDALVDVKTRLRSTGWTRFNDGPDEEEQHEPVMLVVHHTGKVVISEATGGAIERGSSALRAALDVVMGLEDTKPHIRLTVQKLKDGESILPMAVTWDDAQVIGWNEAAGQHMRGRVAVIQPPGTMRSADEEKKIQRAADFAELEALIVAEIERTPNVSIRELAKLLDVDKGKIDRRMAAMKRAGRVSRKGGEYRLHASDMPTPESSNSLGKMAVTAFLDGTRG